MEWVAQLPLKLLINTVAANPTAATTRSIASMFHQHINVHLRSYKSWYNSKYSSGEDIVTEEQWDQIKGSMLSIATIKGGLTAGDWEHLGIVLGTGKNLT